MSSPLIDLHSLLIVWRTQAVELANVLRARMGTDSLAMIRESHGGLLALLEKHARGEAA